MSVPTLCTIRPQGRNGRERKRTLEKGRANANDRLVNTYLRPRRPSLPRHRHIGPARLLGQLLIVRRLEGGRREARNPRKQRFRFSFYASQFALVLRTTATYRPFHQPSRYLPPPPPPAARPLPPARRRARAQPPSRARAPPARWPPAAPHPPAHTTVRWWRGGGARGGGVGFWGGGSGIWGLGGGWGIVLHLE